MGLMRYLNRNNLKAALIDRRFRMKMKNYARCQIDYHRKNSLVKSFPYSASLNTTNVCNLRCKFCEIHYFYKKAKGISGKIFPNYVDTEILENSREWLENVVTLHLSGASGEPFTNPHVFEVIRCLKRYGIRLSMDTNGLLIDQSAGEQLVRDKFDALSVSIHAGDSKTYEYLQGADFDNVISNLRNLVSLKKKVNSKYPRIGINFALNTENAHSVRDLMKLSRDVGVDSFTLYHYYDSRNALEKDISFFSNIEGCNKILEDSYGYARAIGLNIVPASPLYLTSLNANKDKEGSGHCSAPWTTIKFKGCVEYENSEYICVCNRILLLRIDYAKFYGNKENGFQENIWNHPVLHFLRETINSKELNPVCRFCRDTNTPKIRCIDNVEYSHRRDKAVKDFFDEFRNRYEVKEVEGVTLLEENPYRYDEKDGF